MSSETEKWFINENWFEYKGGEYPILFFKGNRPKKGRQTEQVYAVNIEDISSEGDYTNSGNYIECAVNKSRKAQPLPIIRINQSPTLYLRVRLENFIRELGRLVIEKYPESELQDRYIDKNSFEKQDCPFNRFESIWVRRANLKQDRYDQRDFSDLMLCGDLNHAVNKMAAFALHEGILECTNNNIFADFEFFFAEMLDLLWAGGGKELSDCYLTEHDAAKNMFLWRYHALEFMHDPLITFSCKNLDELAEKAWKYAWSREEKDLVKKSSGEYQNRSQKAGYDFDLPPSRRLMMDEMLKRLDRDKADLWKDIEAKHEKE